MSAFGVTRTVLITQLAEAVLKDGPATSFPDGKFGPVVTAWANETARELTSLQEFKAKALAVYEEHKDCWNEECSVVESLGELFAPEPATIGGE